MRNYQKELDKLIADIPEGQVPTLLLHACCAPCSSYCLEYLSEHFKITLYYYNPNIYPESEYSLRTDEARRLISEMSFRHPVTFLEGEFNPKEFYDCIKGYEGEKEGGERCFRCYRLRLERTAELAKKMGFDYFTTTLSISPHKDAVRLNGIGSILSQNTKTKWLWSDFKKKNGYLRSIELSKQYNLYRQDFCGCTFSKAQSEKKN